jgi:hypothetical protein
MMHSGTILLGEAGWKPIWFKAELMSSNVNSASNLWFIPGVNFLSTCWIQASTSKASPALNRSSKYAIKAPSTSA